MQDEGYTKATGKPYPDYGIPLCSTDMCVNFKKPMTFWAIVKNDRYSDHWVCPECHRETAINPTGNWLSESDVVAHDDKDKLTDITQEDWALLIEALEMAVTCREVEVDVAQAEADSKADTLRDLVVLKRKLETA